MAKRIDGRVIKLRLEGSISDDSLLRSYWSYLKVLIYRRYVFSLMCGNSGYPCSLTTLLSLIKYKYSEGNFILGVHPLLLPDDSNTLYSKIEDTEYGVRSEGIRIIRYALEEFANKYIL